MNIAPLHILIGNQDPPSPRLAAFIRGLRQDPALNPVHSGPALKIFGAVDAPHFLLEGGRGLVWGHLFDRMTSARIRGAACLRGGGDEPVARFSERFWGGYLLVRSLGARVEIARDPSGAIPCYHADIDGVQIFTTRPALLFDADALPVEIDWTILAQSLAWRDLRPARTALRGVSELLPGMAASWQDGALATRCFWTPWDFASSAEPPDAALAAERVRRTGRSSLTAWARPFERPLIEVSGGLDSSIVAAVTAAARPEAVAVTFAPAPGDPDETPYARSVADHLGLELHTLRASLDDVDLTRSEARNLPRPCARGFARGFDVPLQALAAELGADSYFSGGGGDNIFCYLQSVLPAIDRLKAEGLTPGLFRTIGDVAALAEVGMWEAGLRTLGRALRPRRPHRWPFAPRWLSRDARHALPFPAEHPWLEVPEPIPPGKRVHGRALIVIQNHLEGLGRLDRAPVVSPLLSQPLVEACLAVPSWQWCEGGINRAVARQAFAPDLPAAVIARRTKGAFDGWCTQVFIANRMLLHEMLLNGALASAGLIDTGAVAAALTTPAVSRHDMIDLLGLADAEAWVSSWQARAVSRAAP